MSSLRSFYAYYFKREMIHTNPTVLVDVPKIHQKSIIRLEADEVAMLLDILNMAVMILPVRKRYTTKRPKTATSLSLLSFSEQAFVFLNV